jgi:pSer/pThr/pTyr-binding forkhead associated (FHA) protein
VFFERSYIDASARICAVLFRDKDVVDIHLDSELVSRQHAAIVHHTSGKVYIIDLQSVSCQGWKCIFYVSLHASATSFHTRIIEHCCMQSHGTFLNGKRLDIHRPTKLLNRHVLRFGGLEKDFVVRSVDGQPGCSAGMLMPLHWKS